MRVSSADVSFAARALNSMKRRSNSARWKPRHLGANCGKFCAASLQTGYNAGAENTNL
jgi:hypothetical protein